MLIVRAKSSNFHLNYFNNWFNTCKSIKQSLYDVYKSHERNKGKEFDRHIN